MPVLIAGGGLAGGAAACLLGPDALLVERETGPHDKVCGEFISAEAIGYLRRLGVDPASLGAARIDAVRLVHRELVAESALPFPALGLSRRALDAAVLARAEAAGATVLRGHAVRRIEAGVADVAGLGRMPGHTVFLASGKHEIRGVHRRPDRAPEALIGLKLHLRLDPAQKAALGARVEVVLFGCGYGGLQPIENGAANLCLLIEQRAFRTAGETWPGIQALLADRAPHLAARLQGATPLTARPLTIARVPYGFVHRAREGDPPDLYRLGDQEAVIPSFSGDGMSIALHTAFAAHHREGAAAFHARMRSELGPQIRRAWRIYRVGRLAPRPMLWGARFAPAALRWAARLTRVPPQALLTAAE